MVADVVRGSDPCKPILCFQTLVGTFFFCQLRYEQVELIASLSINISEIAIQLTAENEVSVDHRMMLSEVLLVLFTPDADDVDFFLRDDQTRQIIISMQLISKSVVVIVDKFFHFTNPHVSFKLAPARSFLNRFAYGI